MRCCAAGASRASACASARRRGRSSSARSAVDSVVEYAAFGDTVNLAARLQSAAAPGTVLVDDATHRALEPLFAWGGGLELALKGKQEPVRAWRVNGVQAGARPQRGLPGVETPLVGRSRELGVGREAVAELRRGRGGVLVVSGEPGMGKTRLLVELRALAEVGGRPLARGPMRLVRGVAPLLAVPRPPAQRLDRRRSRRRRAARAGRPAAPARAAVRGAAPTSSIRISARLLDVALETRRGLPHRTAVARGAAVADLRGRRGALRAAGGGVARRRS